jgi:hypothetical protein
MMVLEAKKFHSSPVVMYLGESEGAGSLLLPAGKDYGRDGLAGVGCQWEGNERDKEGWNVCGVREVVDGVNERVCKCGTDGTAQKQVTHGFGDVQARVLHTLHCLVRFVNQLVMLLPCSLQNSDNLINVNVPRVYVVFFFI